MQQKATLPPNAFLAEFSASLYSQDNSAQETVLTISTGWGQELDDQYSLCMLQEKVNKYEI